ncbi:MAG: hypothetical protein AAGG01_13620, partial [Planctomycetota bacterium]
MLHLTPMLHLITSRSSAAARSLAIAATVVMAASSALGAVQDCSSDDVFEPNNDCAAAIALGDGLYQGLNVESQDPDFYAVEVPSGGALAADILFDSALGDVDLFLWAPGASCGTAVSGPGGPFVELGQSVTGGKTLGY